MLRECNAVGERIHKQDQCLSRLAARTHGEECAANSDRDSFQLWMYVRDRCAAEWSADRNPAAPIYGRANHRLTI